VAESRFLTAEAVRNDNASLGRKETAGKKKRRTGLVRPFRLCLHFVYHNSTATCTATRSQLAAVDQLGLAMAASAVTASARMPTTAAAARVPTTAGGMATATADMASASVAAGMRTAVARNRATDGTVALAQARGVSAVGRTAHDGLAHIELRTRSAAVASSTIGARAVDG
jgi:hypothetical protein